MKLIIENGGSKLDWTISGTDSINSDYGINIFDSDEKLTLKIEKCFSSILYLKEKIDIDFYTAGLTNFSKARIGKIFSKYFNINSINIFSDMLAASRALFDNHNGITCILGTGSNCAYFDGSVNHEITYSTGYLLGDEGSGYALGNMLLRHYFRRTLPLEIKLKFEELINLNRDELISYIYSSQNPKNYIASFTRFIKEYEDHPFIQKMIQDSFLEFLEKNPFKYPSFNQYHFGFVGGVAFHFQSHIRKIMQEKKLKYSILEKPIVNLTKYYL